MGKYVLWRLNRITGWDPPVAMLDAFSREGLFKRKHQLRLGNRNRFNQRFDGQVLEASAAGELMHEGHLSTQQHGAPLRNEYFVPIAVKCLGDMDGLIKRWGGRMRPEGLDQLKQIRAHYAHYYDPEGGEAAPLHWSTFWKPQLGDAMAMNTISASPTYPNFMGLYELMRWTRELDERCILVGYSQGGLVAHYLAWLDEQLFEPKDRLIAGLVTVQAPNYGSPLARLSNEDNVAEGLFRVLSALGGLPAPEPFLLLGRAYYGLARGTMGPPGVASLGAGMERYMAHFDVQAIVSLIEAAITDFRYLSPEFRESRKKTFDFLLTSRKWLTGLTTSTGTAFNDLSLAEFDKPGAVLHDLAAHPLKDTFYGAVIGANYQVTDFVRSAFKGVWSLVAKFVLPKLKERLQGAERSYREVVMRETLGLPPAAESIAQDYQEGVWVYGTEGKGIHLERLTHDFVIPAACQALGPRWRTGKDQPRCPPNFLGNALNEDAAHMSGADRSDSGTSDEGYVVEFLKEMGKGLP